MEQSKEYAMTQSKRDYKLVNEIENEIVNKIDYEIV